MVSENEKKINYNLPPGTTPLSNEDLAGLIPKFITTRTELNDAEFKNITEASNRYLMSKKKFGFTGEKLFKLHKEMFGKVWKWAGKKRVSEKNIGVAYFKIDIEMKRLLDDLEYWEKNSIDLKEISARLHHRMVYIHPFNNGNGRWARLAVNLFLKDNSGTFLNFPEDKLILTSTIRNTYIQALQQADVNNFSSLILFHNKYIDEFFI